MSVEETLKACIRMFSDMGFINRFRIDYNCLCRWLLSVKKNYRAVTYHNWRHAFNVAQTMFVMFKVCSSLLSSMVISHSWRVRLLARSRSKLVSGSVNYWPIAAYCLLNLAMVGIVLSIFRIFNLTRWVFSSKYLPLRKISLLLILLEKEVIKMGLFKKNKLWMYSSDIYKISFCFIFFFQT